MSRERGVAGSDVAARAEAPGSGRKTASLLVLALCLALISVLVAHAGAYTRYVSRFGGPGSGGGSLRLPGGIAVSPDGESVYVADTGNNRISEFTAGGNFVRAWGYGVSDGKSKLETCRELCVTGQTGQSDGELNEPSAIAVAPDGTVYVMNHARFDGRIQAFDPSGPEVEWVETLPAGYERTGPGETSFGYPLPYSNDLAVDSEGRIYVGDLTEGETTSSRVYVFEAEEGLVKTIPVTAVERITTFTLAPPKEEGGEPRLWVTDRGGDTYLLEPDGSVVFKLETFFSFSSLTVDPATGNLLTESTAFNSEGEVELKEFDGGGKFIRGFLVGTLTQSGEEPYTYGLAIDNAPTFAREGESEPENEPGVIYLVDRYGGGVNILADAKPLPPTFKSPYGEEKQATVQEVGSTGATLTAELRPRGLDTHVYFEFGPTATYGSTSPAPPGFDLGDSFLFKAFSARLAGLQPNTTYHYRLVATNSAGTLTSPDATFTTFPVGGPFSLPDNRAYELASPDAGTNNLGGIFAAPGGNGVSFASSSILPGSSSGGIGSSYVGLRGPEGWRREAATIPVDASLSTPTLLISADMTKSVGPSPLALTPGAPAGEKLYLRDNATGTYELMTPRVPSGYVPYSIYGASTDAGHVFFRSSGQLTPDVPEGFVEHLFEFTGGSLKNAAFLPGASTPTESNIEGTSAPYAVSEDGSRVFFATERGPGEGIGVFARIDAARTVEISASQATTPDPEGATQYASFLGATPDGSVAYFTSNARLTDDAYTGRNTETGQLQDAAPNLYRYDLGTGKLTDITVATQPSDEERGAAVTGAVVVAPSGDSAYFVATGNLAPGGTTGKQNLYRWTLGGGIRFVAALGESSSEPLTNAGPARSDARTSTDGSVLAFDAITALDPAFPEVEGSENSEPRKEIYRYSAADGSLVCVSCGRADPVIRGAQLGGPPAISAGYGGHFLSADGSRVFFQTPAALVPGDSNGKSDVYEWENGAAHLISSGAGTGGSALVDASVSGDDVFITTADQLVPADRTSYVDVYDAKVNGGLAEPAPAQPCVGDACLPTAATAPTAATNGSGSFNGPANKKAKHHRKKHKKKHRKHKKHGKRKRSHGHPSVGKRG